MMHRKQFAGAARGVTRSAGVCVAALIVAGFGVLGGCAREEHATGSIKDDAPHARPASRPRVAAYAPERAARPAPAAEKPVRAAKAEADTTPVKAEPAPTKSAAAPPPAKPAAAPAPSKTIAAPAPAQPATPVASAPADRPAPAIAAPQGTRPVAAAQTPPAQSAAPAAAGPSPADAAKIAALMKEGRELFAAGKVPDSRLRFLNAMDLKSPEAVHALARSFDTHYLNQLANNNGVADMQRAMRYYQMSVEAKQPGAPEDLARIRAALGLLPQ